MNSKLKDLKALRALQVDYEATRQRLLKNGREGWKLMGGKDLPGFQNWIIDTLAHPTDVIAARTFHRAADKITSGRMHGIKVTKPQKRGRTVTGRLIEDAAQIEAILTATRSLSKTDQKRLRPIREEWWSIAEILARQMQWGRR